MKGDIDDTQVDLCGVQRANEERMSLTWSQHVPTTHLPSPSSHRPLPKTTAPQWLNPYTFLSCFIITYSQLPGTYTAPPNNSHPNWKRSKPGLISTNRRMKPPWGWPQAPHNPSLKKGKQPIDKLPQIVDVFACLKETPFYLWFGSLSLSLSISICSHSSMAPTAAMLILSQHHHGTSTCQPPLPPPPASSPTRAYLLKWFSSESSEPKLSLDMADTAISTTSSSSTSASWVAKSFEDVLLQLWWRWWCPKISCMFLCIWININSPSLHQSCTHDSCVNISSSSLYFLFRFPPVFPATNQTMPNLLLNALNVGFDHDLGFLSKFSYNVNAGIGEKNPFNPSIQAYFSFILFF